MISLAGFFRNFEPVIREMLERGHEVHLALERDDKVGGERWIEALREEYPSLSWSRTPGLKDDEFHPLMSKLRITVDYLQTLDPRFHAAPHLAARARGRAERHAPDFLAFAEQRLAGRRRTQRAIARTLSALEHAVPPSAALDRYVAEHAPDVVMLTPHLMPGSVQTWSLRSAQAQGIPTAVCVASWDNLTSKQVLPPDPDAVLVWNDVQREEAVELHGIPEDRIVVTGAQLYDQWFDWQPRPREEFCRRVGLPAGKPFVLYLGGALFPAELTEAEWAAGWIRRVREELGDMAMLVRPHPKRLEEWSRIELPADDVALWPRTDAMPVEAEAKADLYDSLYHAEAVVGLNTSAMIEAGIVGKRVHTVLVPEFKGSQEGVFHFRYLTEVGGGLLHVAGDLDEHLAQLRDSVSAKQNGNPNRGFLEAFVRPQGLDQPATPVFVDAIERLAASGPRGRRAHLPVPRAVLSEINDHIAIGNERRRARRKRQEVPPRFRRGLRPTKV